MIIVGDISGIQPFIFKISDGGGGQARRLRARSFLIQLMSEAAALRVLGAVGWPNDHQHLLLSIAGKFVLSGEGFDDITEKLEEEEEAIKAHLRMHSRGEIRFSMAWADGASEVDAYRAAIHRLHVAKLRPWAPASGRWSPAALLLDPLDTPCALCGHATATETEADSDTGEERAICVDCARDYALGQRLPRLKWLRFTNSSAGSEYAVVGLGVSLSDSERMPESRDSLAVLDLRSRKSRRVGAQGTNPSASRNLLSYVPTRADGSPAWFVDIAAKSRGDALLGVLKADGDSLGIAISGLLEESSVLAPLTTFSRELDGFFSGTLSEEIENEERWRSIYTIFAGGDDLTMVGPWDVMIDFAGRVEELFQARFGSRGITLSAGLALIRPTRPIKTAVAEAHRLLERAKSETSQTAQPPKNQVACFREVWKWQHHRSILQGAKQLVEWVGKGEIERGWIHTLLTLSEMRLGDSMRNRAPDPIATSRFAYHVERNYRKRSESRAWAEHLLARFDDVQDVEIRYLPAIARYALTATRSRGASEKED